eukprot:jgi/Mesen1/6312/ME000325S05453
MSTRTAAGSVRCWDLASGSCVLEYTGHLQGATGVAALQGGRRAASIAGSSLHIWDVSTGEKLAHFEEPPRPRAAAAAAVAQGGGLQEGPASSQTQRSLGSSTLPPGSPGAAAPGTPSRRRSSAGGPPLSSMALGAVSSLSLAAVAFSASLASGSSGSLPAVHPGTGGSTLRLGGSPSSMLNSWGSPRLQGGRLTADYACLLEMSGADRLAVGTTDGRISFVDLGECRQLSSWICTPGGDDAHLSSSTSACVTSIAGTSPTSSCSSSSSSSSLWPWGDSEKSSQRAASWIAVGLESGLASVLDSSTGEIIATWRAHTKAITQMATIGDWQVATSSSDRTIAIWDLRRRGAAALLQTNRGPAGGITCFAERRGNLLSASGYKVGLSSVLGSQVGQEGVQQKIESVKLAYGDDGSYMTTSHISTLHLLPLSRLFLIGTQDGWLHICA